MKIEIDSERINSLFNRVLDYGTVDDFSNVLAAVLYLVATDAQAADFISDEISDACFTELGNEVVQYLYDHGVNNPLA